MESAATSVLDSGVLTFVVDGVKQVIGIMTIQPLGTFLTIGILGSIAGLTAGIIRMVRRH